MSWSSCGSSTTCNLSSSILVANDPSSKLLKRRFAPSISQLGWKQRRDYLHNNGGVPKVFGYYGLKSPPYKLDALEPYMSQRTLEVHWGVHHRDYVEALNKQLEKNDTLYGCTMDELIKVLYNNSNPFPEFNDAARFGTMISFGNPCNQEVVTCPLWAYFSRSKMILVHLPISRRSLQRQASHCLVRLVWLVLKREAKCLAIIKTSNSINPLVWNDIPSMGLDMWEHAYYLDYRNDKAKYVNAFMNHLVSWNAAVVRMVRAQAFVNLGEPKIPVA